MNRQERRRQRKTRGNSGKATDGISPDVATAQQLDDASGHYDAGRLDEAAESCLDAIAGAPLDFEPYHLLALIRYRQGRLQDAGENILEAITRNENDPELHANCGAIMNMLGRHPEAEAACRHAIELKPANAEAHSNLAVALEMQGRIEEAKKACGRAIQINPDYPEALINLGNLYVRSGDYVSGVEAYVKAIQQAPENPTARANLSVALLRLEESDEALLQAQEAVDLSPDYVEALNALGNALSAKGDYVQAEDVFRKAYVIQPAHREAGMNLAATLHKSGRSDDAITTYQQILDINSGLAEAENGLGVVLLALGKTDDATTAFRRAIKIRPALADAWYNLASSDHDLSDEEVKDIQNLLEKSDISAQQRISLNFALAERADRKRDTDASMFHLNAGNNMRRNALSRNEIVFDGDQLDRDVANISRTFSTSLLTRLQSLGNNSEVPVFLCGMPRSGTTLVEQIITSHPQAGSVGEMAVVADLLEDYPGEIINLSKNRIEGLCQRVLERLTIGTGQLQRVIDKSPFGFFHIGLMQVLFPNARVVHCQRNPMDVGLSCYAQNFIANHPWSTDLTDIGRYIRAESRMMEHWKSVLSLPLLDVSYEDIIADQEGQSRRIIEFLGLGWDDACLRFHDNGKTVLTASNWQVRKPLYSRSVGKAEGYGDHLKALREGLSG